jgi:hypothetical protein
MHRSQKLVGDGDQEYSNEKRVVNVRVDGTAHLPESLRLTNLVGRGFTVNESWAPQVRLPKTPLYRAHEEGTESRALPNCDETRGKT